MDDFRLSKHMYYDKLQRTSKIQDVHRSQLQSVADKPSKRELN